MFCTSHRWLPGQKLENFIERHTSEGELLEDAINDTGNVTLTSVKERLKAIQGEPDSKPERDILMACLNLIADQSEKSKAIKKEQEALDQQVLVSYATLTETEIKALVIENKWFAMIREAIMDEVQRSVQALAERVSELEERYAQSLAALENEVQDFSFKVNEHLWKMGVTSDDFS